MEKVQEKFSLEYREKIIYFFKAWSGMTTDAF